MNYISRIYETSIFQKISEKKLYIGLALFSYLMTKNTITNYISLRREYLSKTQLSNLKNNFIKRRQKQIDIVTNLISNVPEERQREIISLTTQNLSQAIKEGKYTCEEVFLTFAYRAATLGIEYNVICDIDIENNLEIARQKDKFFSETENKSNLPRLFGLPITVKEHLTVKGLVSCCGYVQLSGKEAEKQDCVFIQLLRNEGVIPFASTNIPQGLFAIETNNNIYGRALNPLNKKLTVGGSSGGEGGAQCLRLSAFGIGSDSLGSARIPAAFCGVNSFKGTGKRVSLKGRLGLTGTDLGGFKDLQTSMGPISQYIDDLIEVEKIVLGNFNKLDEEVPPLYWNQKIFDETNLKNVRIGVFRGSQYCPNVPAIENMLNEVVSKLKEQGVDTHEMVDIPIDQMSTQISKLLATPGVQLIILKMLRGEELLNIHKPYVLIKLFPNWFNNLRIKLLNKFGQKREADLISSQKANDFITHFGESIKLEVIKKQIQQYIKSQKLDIIISPVLPFTAIKHDDGGNVLKFLGIAGLANVLDLPAGVLCIRSVKPEETNPNNYKDIYNDKYTQIIKSNIELSENMPLCIQVQAQTWNDEKCLKIMKEMSQLFPYQNKKF